MFNKSDDIVIFESHCRELESSIALYSYTDISEALMSAVELKPEIIYIDKKIPLIDHYHLINQS
jgi:hypothetical protein